MTTGNIIGWIFAGTYGCLFVGACIAAFLEEDPREVDHIILGGILWPIMLVMLVVFGPFWWLSERIGKWRAGILQRRREQRWALADAAAAAAKPPALLPPAPVDYRHAQCSQCGHTIEESALR